MVYENKGFWRGPEGALGWTPKGVIGVGLLKESLGSPPFGGLESDS
jgi:hypothetical protein